MILTVDKIISLIILSAYGMILGTFYIDIAVTSYFLFFIIVLSFAGLFLLRSGRDNIFNLVIIFDVITMFHYLLYFGSVKLVDELIVISVVNYLAVVYYSGLSTINRKLLVYGAILSSVNLFIQFPQLQHWTYQKWLQYVYVNPNTAASVALNLFVIVLCACTLSLSKIKKFGLIAIAGGLLFVIYNTASRSNFLCAIIFIVLLLSNQFSLIKVKWIKLYAIIPVLAIPIMTILMTYVIPQDTELLGKVVHSGRDELWWDAIQIILNNVVHFQNTYATNLNLALRLPHHSGLIGAVLFFVVLRKLLIQMQMQNEYPSTRINLGILAFCCLLFAQSTESTLISGSFAICFISVSIIGFTRFGVEGESNYSMEADE